MPDIQITIPMAIQLVIEDVGWWDKSFPIGPNSPFRSGLKRRHHPRGLPGVGLFGQAVEHASAHRFCGL